MRRFSEAPTSGGAPLPLLLHRARPQRWDGRAEGVPLPGGLSEGGREGDPDRRPFACWGWEPRGGLKKLGVDLDTAAEELVDPETEDLAIQMMLRATDARSPDPFKPIRW